MGFKMVIYFDCHRFQRFYRNFEYGIGNGDSIILSLLGQFLLLPSVVLAAKICPDGVEGSLYATLMSISNFAGVISSEWGSMLSNMYGVNRNHFDNFWKLIVLCNLIDLIPIASVALVTDEQDASIKPKEELDNGKLPTVSSDDL